MSGLAVLLSAFGRIGSGIRDCRPLEVDEDVISTCVEGIGPD